MAKLEPIADHFRVIKDKYIKDGTLNPKMLTPDPRALLYQVQMCIRDRSNMDKATVVGLGLVVVVIAVLLGSAFILQKSPKSLLQDTE